MKLSNGILALEFDERNGSLIQITDPGAASAPQRFYRARLTP